MLLSISRPRRTERWLVQTDELQVAFQTTREAQMVLLQPTAPNSFPN